MNDEEYTRMTRVIAPSVGMRSPEELEREFAERLRPLTEQAKAIQLAAFVGEAVAELELLLSAGRPDFSPEFEAMWKTGVKQSINRLKAMTDNKDNT